MTAPIFRDRGLCATLCLAAAVTLAACRPTPAQRSVEIARDIAALETPAQQRLWRDAATAGAAVGLDRLAVVARPVSPRLHAAGASPAAAPAPPQASVVIPPEVQSQLRIVSAPPLSTAYTGTARVVAKSGDRLEFDFGGPGRLVVLARAGGTPIPVDVNEQVQLVYAPRATPRANDETLVIRTRAGKGIGRVIRGADAPVSVTVPLFGITGSNAIYAPPAAAAAESSGVDIVVPGGAPRRVQTGETVPFGPLFVMVIASHARPQPRAGSGESPAYLVNLLVWSP